MIKFDATIRRIIDETPETKSFILDAAGGFPQFLPGQFVNLTMEIPDRGRVKRAYSIASSPMDPEFVLTVKRMDDGVLSTYLCGAVRPGDVLPLRGPYGIFTLNESARHVVFVAAGSGIVPFRSMWRYIRQKELDMGITLLYASKSLQYVIYREELESLDTKQVKLVHTFTRNQDPSWRGYSRRIDREMLVECIKDFDGKLFYVCGPPAMCNCVVADLLDLHVERDFIKTEKYD